MLDIISCTAVLWWWFMNKLDGGWHFGHAIFAQVINQKGFKISIYFRFSSAWTVFCWHFWERYEIAQRFPDVLCGHPLWIHSKIWTQCSFISKWRLIVNNEWFHLPLKTEHLQNVPLFEFSLKQLKGMYVITNQYIKYPMLPKHLSKQSDFQGLFKGISGLLDPVAISRKRKELSKGPWLLVGLKSIWLMIASIWKKINFTQTLEMRIWYAFSFINHTFFEKFFANFWVKRTIAWLRGQLNLMS